MAIFKRAGGGSPPPNQRIDDVIWTFNKPTPTQVSYHYPTERPSPRFNYVNDYIIQLDAQYNELYPPPPTAALIGVFAGVAIFEIDADDPDPWEEFWDLYWWALYCKLFE